MFRCTILNGALGHTALGVDRDGQFIDPQKDITIFHDTTDFRLRRLLLLVPPSGRRRVVLFFLPCRGQYNIVIILLLVPAAPSPDRVRSHLGFYFHNSD